MKLKYKGKKGGTVRQILYDRVVKHIVDNQEKFYRLAFSYVHNQEDALDVVQNAIYKALEHYDELRNERAINTWFYRILVNESLLLLRKRKEEVVQEVEGAVEIPYYEAAYDKDDDLYEQINHLNQELQHIIKLRFYEELSLKEISDVMDMNLNTVKAKLYRGLKLLKQNILEVDI